MKIIKALLVLTLLLLTGCGTDKKENSAAGEDKLSITRKIEQAVSGDRYANDSLSGLIDYSLPLNTSYNRLIVELYKSSNGKSFFAVLIEFPNPLYNRFAVYDSALNPLVIDKSLNGNISMQMQNIKGLNFVEVKEVFLTKDVYELNRLSLYNVNYDMKLVFRAFTKFVTPRNTYYQVISELSRERIRTDFLSDKYSNLQGKSDIYLLDYNDNTYKSSHELFGTLVKQELGAVTKAVDKPEITDEKSALQSVGITLDADTIKSASNISSKAFELTVTEGWKEYRNVQISGYSPEPLNGSSFVNVRLGAKIYVVDLKGKPAETYFKHEFKHVSGTSAKIRYTDKIESKKYYHQFFEYSCGNSRFILVFEASKFTYEQYKPEYEAIIQSFSMDCN